MRPTRALYAAFLCVGLTFSGRTAAQSAGASAPMEEAPQISDQARALYVQGMKAAEKKDWPAAHAAFLEAWKLNEHYQIAANLGSMEIKLGRNRDACEHLAIYLRKAPQDKVKDRMRAMAFFDEAKKKVGTVQLTTNVNGAEILVDDKVVALSPPLDDIFVDPGPRNIKVRLSGYKTAEAAIEAGTGTVHPLPLTLTKLSADAAPPVLAPEPPAKPAPLPMPTEEPFKPARPVIFAGVAVGAVGLLGGIIFTAVANGQASDADERAAGLRASSIASTGTPYACSTGKYDADCQRLRDLRVGADTFGDVAVWSFVIGGVAGAGTAVYALVLPKVLKTKSSSTGPDARTAAGLSGMVVPMVSPTSGGLVWSGSF